MTNIALDNRVSKDVFVSYFLLKEVWLFVRSALQSTPTYVFVTTVVAVMVPKS